MFQMFVSKSNIFKKLETNGPAKGPCLNAGSTLNIDQNNTFKPGLTPNIDLSNRDKNKIQILRKPNFLNNPKEDISRIIYPTLPYHKRWELYVQKRNEIFSANAIEAIKPPKRSTIRLRKFFQLRKICGKIQISSIFTNPQDMRYYAKVSFLNFVEYGLLDTGANVSCIGGDLAKTDFTKYPTFNRCKSFVKTADGKRQNILAWIDVTITFKEKTSNLKIFIIPTISQRLILGIDFWKSFQLLPNFTRSLDVLVCNSNGIWTIRSMNN